MTERKKKAVQAYVFFILTALAVGGISAFIARDNMNIYDEIIKPPLAPAGFLFPVVWTVLYILMGISAAMVWLQRDKNNDKAVNALLWYAASLVVNFIWSPLFFNFRLFLPAFIVLAVLLILILKTVWEYRGIFPFAAYLQIPYIIWVSFAGYLNLAIWILNK